MKNILLIFLFVGGISSAAPLPSENKQPPTNEKREQSKSEQAKTDVTSPPPIVQIRNEVSGYGGEQSAAKEDKHPFETLAWASTFVAALIALLALVVAGIQAWFFKEQLGKMERALNDSKSMADAAKTSADASLQQALNIQRASRAYVLPNGEDEFSRKGNTIEVTVRFQNYGQTPANNVLIAMKTNSFGMPYSGLFEAQDFNKGSRTSIGPGGVVTQSVKIPVEDAEKVYEWICSKAGGMFIWGEVVYNDIFGDEQHTFFRRLSTGEDFRSGAMVVCEDGNEST